MVDIPKTMNAVMKTRPGKGAEVVKDAPVPTPGPHDLLVKVRATSICGTDIHIYNWDELAQQRVKLPMVFGHEFAGEVVDRGSACRRVNVGDHISAESHIACGLCFQCKTGNQHICERVKILGIDTPGCYAEYAVIPEDNAWVNDPKLPFEIGSVQEPLGNAVHSVLGSDGGDIPAANVAIFGMGPIGLCACSVAKAAGAYRVIAVDINDYRLDLAKKMGATVTINASKEDPVKKIHDLSERGADVFLEMSGSPKALNDGLKALRVGGRASLLGLPSKPVTIDVSNDIVFKALKIDGIFGRKMYQTWYQVRRLLRIGAVDLSKLITHKFPLENFTEAMELVISGNCGKVVLIP